jgi:hypothetical protein
MPLFNNLKFCGTAKTSRLNQNEALNKSIIQSDSNYFDWNEGCYYQNDSCLAPIMVVLVNLHSVHSTEMQMAHVGIFGQSPKKD